MKSSSLLLVGSIAVACLIGMGVACTLNPQPLPPDTPDGSAKTEDATFAGLGSDGGGASPTTGSADGNADGGDNIANGDGGADATSDAALDASEDADVDGATD